MSLRIGELGESEAHASQGGADRIHHKNRNEPEHRIERDAEHGSHNSRSARQALVKRVDAHHVAFGNQLGHERHQRSSVERLSGRAHREQKQQ